MMGQRKGGCDVNLPPSGMIRLKATGSGTYGHREFGENVGRGSQGRMKKRYSVAI
jgi:hypothetical protein